MNCKPYIKPSIVLPVLTRERGKTEPPRMAIGRVQVREKKGKKV